MDLWVLDAKCSRTRLEKYPFHGVSVLQLNFFVSRNPDSHPAASPSFVTAPWIHVGMFFAGAYVGNTLPKIERQLVVDINEMRASKGLTPMVGTNAWIRYQTDDDETKPM